MIESERKIENFVFEFLIDLNGYHKCIFLECLSSMMGTIGFSGKRIDHLFLRFVYKLFHHMTIESFELCTILLQFEYLKHFRGNLTQLAKNENII